MSNKNRVPSIRFMGFKGEWAEKNFINCLAKIIDFRGKTPKKLGLSWSNNGKYRALSALNVKNGFIDKNIDVHFGNYDLYKKWMGNTELKKGDILFTTEAPMGNIAIIKDDEKYILSQRTIAFRVDEKNINGPFLLYKLNTVSTKNKLMSLSTGGTAQGISQKNLSYLFISVSNDLNEQQKIGDFFTKLDKLLDLQQQKIDKLELLKKALLQKLFPKHDAQIPEFRFKGCNGEWEDCLVGNLLEVVPNKKYITEASKKGLNPVIQQGEKPILGFSNKAPYKEYKKVVLFGDHTLSLYKPKSPFLIATDGIKILYVKDWNGYFLFAFLQKYKPDSEGYKRHFSILKSKKAKFTVIDEEQQKIGNLLSKVDQLIELENKKLQNFQQVKKFLLKNMFVE